jgi:hypothetical protein
MSQRDERHVKDVLALLDFDPDVERRVRREMTIMAQLHDAFVALGQGDRFMVLYHGMISLQADGLMDAFRKGAAAEAEARADDYRRGRLDQLKEDCAAIGCRVPEWALEMEAELDECRDIRRDRAERRRMELEQAAALDRAH